MKKFLFIIPKVFYFKFLMLFAFVCMDAKTKAQVYGCHVVVAMSDRLYYTPYNSGSPLEWQTVISGPITTTGETGGYRSDGSASFGCIADLGGSCTVFQQYLTSDGVTTAMRPYKSGFYANIDPTNCPIDDYVYLMITFVSTIGFFRIRKFAILKNAYESKSNHSCI